jgi:hypothetical protein
MLMKQDSYRRFLKSELYEACLMQEMQSMTRDVAMDTSVCRSANDKTKSNGKDMGIDNKGVKRRRSLLPWRRQASVKKLADVALSVNSDISTEAVIKRQGETTKHDSKRRRSLLFGLFQKREIGSAEKRRRSLVGPVTSL